MNVCTLIHGMLIPYPGFHCNSMLTLHLPLTWIRAWWPSNEVQINHFMDSFPSDHVFTPTFMCFGKQNNPELLVYTTKQKKLIILNPSKMCFFPKRMCWGLQDLSSPTRNQTWVLGSERAKSCNRWSHFFFSPKDVMSSGPHSSCHLPFCCR